MNIIVASLFNSETNSINKIYQFFFSKKKCEHHLLELE